jgi:primosomal protein N' (replication factor Y) (superfamily II helicase)
MAVLMVHCRKGLFQLTMCNNCGHKWGCQNCSCNLITYRRQGSLLELLCHQCQTSYSYPASCPKCKSDQIVSNYGGIDDLEEKLITTYHKTVVRLDKVKESFTALALKYRNRDDTIFLTTRIFDPSLDYSFFEKIIFIQAENLLSQPDYLVQEEITKSLAEVFLQLSSSNAATEVIFDTRDSSSDFFQKLIRLNNTSPEPLSLKEWYEQFLRTEANVREAFSFPPFVNLLLLTTHEKKSSEARNKLSQVASYLKSIKNEFPEISFSNAYSARFLKRKGYYSYHLLIRFPRNYAKFKLLRKEVKNLSSSKGLQIRLNPRHTF